MKLLSTAQLLILVVSTILLILCAKDGSSTALHHDEQVVNKPICPKKEGEESVSANFLQHCELPHEHSCYLRCSTEDAICQKKHIEETDENPKHNHTVPESNQEPAASNSGELAVCSCPVGKDYDPDANKCTGKEKGEQKVTGSGDEPASEAGDPSEKNNGNATDAHHTHKHKDSNSGSTTEGPDASVRKAEDPDEAPKSKSNVGLTVGVITLIMFAMILVFLLRHRINHAFRRMCGGSHPVPQHEN